jgi:hypothetical protein
MAVFAIAGSLFELGAAVATKSADFLAADFTTPMTAPAIVGEPETIGAVSDAWEVEDFGNVTDGRIRSIKTMRKGSTFELTCGLDPLDAGQLAMRTAWAARANYAMRMTLADKPATGASPKNSTRTWVGTVLNVEDDPSGKLGKVKFTVQINSNILVTHASAT